MKIEAPHAPKMARVAERYLLNLGATLRPGSVGHYACVIKQFLCYLAGSYPEVKTFKGIRRFPHIEGYLKYLTSTSVSKTTRQQRLVCLRRFFKDMQRWGWPGAPKGELIVKEDIPSPDRYLPRPLSPEADKAIREALKKDDSVLADCLLLLRATGLRIGELMDLELDCLQKLSPNEWILRVPLGKLHSERVVPLSDEALESLNRILDVRHYVPPVPHPDTKVPTDFLLAHPGKGRYRLYEALRAKLAETARSVGVTEKVTPHRLRHSYATELLYGGMGIVGIKTLLGHRSIGMTLRYAAVVPTHLFQEYHRAIEKAHIRYEQLESPARSSVKEDRTVTPASIIDDLRDISTRLETYRRDHASSPRTKRLQRLGERLQRLIDDLSQSLLVC